MKGKSMLLAACAAVAAMAHTGVEAATGRDGLEACVEALTQRISEMQGAGVNARISDDSSYAGHRLDSPTMFHLDARDANAGDVVFRADCVVNSRGQVQRLVQLPDSAPNAETRVKL